MSALLFLASLRRGAWREEMTCSTNNLLCTTIKNNTSPSYTVWAVYAYNKTTATHYVFWPVHTSFANSLHKPCRNEVTQVQTPSKPKGTKLLQLILRAMKMCCKWRNRAAENVIYSRECLAVIHNWQYTVVPYFPLQGKGKLEGQASCFANSKHSSHQWCCKVYCWVLYIPTCNTRATQIESSNMTCIRCFYKIILEKRCAYLDKHGIML
jgi:hypothetical protein